MKMKQSETEHGMGKVDEEDKAQRSRLVNLGSMAEILFLSLLLLLDHYWCLDLT